MMTSSVTSQFTAFPLEFRVLGTLEYYNLWSLHPMFSKLYMMNQPAESNNCSLPRGRVVPTTALVYHFDTLSTYSFLENIYLVICVFFTFLPDLIFHYTFYQAFYLWLFKLYILLYQFGALSAAGSADDSSESFLYTSILKGWTFLCVDICPVH